MTAHKRTAHATKPTTGKPEIAIFDAAAQRRWRQHQARKLARFLAGFFTETSNPIYAWQAIERCLRTDTPLPRWTRDYLLRVAGEIGHLSEDRVPRKGRVDRAVARAVGFNGGPRFNPFTNMADYVHGINAAREVYAYKTRHRHYKWRAIFADVAALHHQWCENCTRKMGTKTVERYWRQHARTVIPRRLMAGAKSQKLNDILR